MNPVLIVDDDAELRKAISLLLVGLCSPVEASDGHEALRRLSSERPRLVLLDVAMPGMGGIALLEAAMALDPGIAVWMLTAESDLAVAKEALGLGARAYITKPFDGPELRSQVERFLAAGGGPAYRPWHVVG